MSDKTITVTNAQRLHLLKHINNDVRTAQNSMKATVGKLTLLYELQNKLTPK